MEGLKSAILANFQNGLGWLCPVSAALKNPSKEFKNSFCFGCQLIPRKTGKYNQKGPIQSGKITVCSVITNLVQEVDLDMAQSSTTGRYTSDITLQLCFSTILKIPTILFLIIGGPRLFLRKRTTTPRNMSQCDFLLITYKIPLMKMGNYLLNNSWSCPFKYNNLVQARVDNDGQS